MANNDNYLSFFSSFWVPLFWKGKDSKKKPGHGSSSVQLFGVVNSGYMMYIQVTKLDMYINIYIYIYICHCHHISILYIYTQLIQEIVVPATKHGSRLVTLGLRSCRHLSKAFFKEASGW